MKAGVISLGCAKNLVDTENMLGLMRAGGVELTKDAAEADVIIVNTCAFIESAKQESIVTILNMADYKEKGRCRALIVAGCLGERYGEELLAELPEVDAIVGAGAWDRILEGIEAAQRKERVVLTGESGRLIYDADTPRIMTTPAYTAYVKIAEGCDHRCAFCAIPMIRGPYRSRLMDDIVREVKHLALDGVKEINLIAQDTTSYGRDIYGEPSLPRLLRKLVKTEGIHWIRILYSYPRFFSDELIDIIAQEPKIAKYVDLPLQHADDAVLSRMRRADTKDSIEALLTKIRTRIPDVAIRSTFMVGFPGETDEEYLTLRAFLEKWRFDRAGVFTYSEEEGTLAAKLCGKVGEETMRERYHDLMSLQSKISEEINRSIEGRVLEVLIEGRDEEQENVAYGRTYRDAPDVDGQAFVEGDTKSEAGDIVRMRVDQGFSYDVVGELTP